MDAFGLISPVVLPVHPPPERALHPALLPLGPRADASFGEALARIPLPYGWRRVQALSHQARTEPHQAASAIERVDDAVDAYDDVKGVRDPEVHHDLELLCRDRNALSWRLHEWNRRHAERERMHEYERRMLLCDYPHLPWPAHYVRYHHAYNPYGMFGRWGDVERQLVPFEAPRRLGAVHVGGARP